MTPLSNITGNMLAKFIQANNYVKVRQRGSHIRYKHPTKKLITLNVTGQKVIKPGRLQGLLKEMQITKKVFFDFFNIDHPKKSNTCV